MNHQIHRERVKIAGSTYYIIIVRSVSFAFASRRQHEISRRQDPGNNIVRSLYFLNRRDPSSVHFLSRASHFNPSICRVIKVSPHRSVAHEIQVSRLTHLSFDSFDDSRNIASGDRGGLFGAGGRFKGGVDPIMEKFNESISFDKR
jgi:hypothetical protein